MSNDMKIGSSSERRFFLTKKCRVRKRLSDAAFGCGGQILTDDLWVMSPTSYQAAPPRDMKLYTPL